jgi:LysM repeat protein
MKAFSLNQPENRGKFQFWFFVILGLHGTVLGLVLLQGCRNSEQTAEGAVTNNIVEQVPALQTNAPAVEVPLPTNAPAVAAPTTTNPPMTSFLPPKAEPIPAPVPESFKPAVPIASQYTVLGGDTLFKISSKLHVTVKGMMNANPGLDVNKLRPGQVLQVPAAAPLVAKASITTASAPVGGSYTIRKGDTLTKIAKAHGTTVKELQTLNGLKNDKLGIGKTLKLPAAAGAKLAGKQTEVIPPTPPSGTDAVVL